MGVFERDRDMYRITEVQSLAKQTGLWRLHQAGVNEMDNMQQVSLMCGKAGRIRMFHRHIAANKGLTKGWI